ncbi:MAG: DUF4168 domain-containing protein [Gammaproteobacteria bacterium]|nr:DUF4168 domain-containing protein [Gammaproteobacteria bacterium]
MSTVTKILSSLALSLIAFGAAAQPESAPTTPDPVPAEPQAPLEPEDVTDEDMETFATIYVALQETAEKYEQEIAAVESEEEAQAVQARLQQESIGTLQRHGWTPDQFNRVAEALNRDPEKVQKTLRLIEEKH